MENREESYLTTVVGALLCLFFPVILYDIGIEAGFWGVFQRIYGWQQFENYYKYLSFVIFPSLAIIGSFLYLRRRGVPGKTCCLFLLLNPAVLYLGFLCLWGIDLLL